MCSRFVVAILKCPLMANSFSQELEDLLNPLPKFADPEDDHDEATKARVSDTFAGDDDEAAADAEAGIGALRRINAIMPAESDGRYLGKAVSRQQLFLMDMEQDQDDDLSICNEEDGSAEDLEEDDDNEEADEDEVETDEDEVEADEDEVEADEDEEEADEDEAEADEDEAEADEDEAEADEDEAEADANVSLAAGVNIHKLTSEMDKPSASEDDSSDETEDDQEEERAISTFSEAKVDEEVEKSRAVRNQLAVWERLLEARIKMQKVLASGNRLPGPLVLPLFRASGGAGLVGAVKNAGKALKALQRSLLELHDQLMQQSSEQVLLAFGEEEDDNKERSAPKRKLDMSDYPEMASKRFAAFRPYRDATLQKWHDKTRLSSGKGGGGNFGAFERNVVSQVEQILMDKERLVRRTQTRRSEYRILGTGPERELASADPSDEERHRDRLTPAGGSSHDVDEDIFDDDDFYHQLLRELIERKTGGSDANPQVAAGRQWLQIQKLRSKIKKVVDTKASKGRKVRFVVHTKLLNFMAPVLYGQDTLAHDARTELYQGLFGLRPLVLSPAICDVTTQ
ncbi:calcium load-activated calcium channel isoform X1 [Syngnathus typhle]|uniref:calcium load-activated calcium channel isoform X1 n=1 Tax=Syngnathus typhle TaxID=161592 RepID=UPI002A69BA09|nr:calcium load-activated calcium channel isoform X1 [Syngnathus typhle]XP_061154170.1 calcium load-activated calcium channel isoform X1 [Syngnathus typhle]